MLRDYVPPRNAVVELLRDVPQELHDGMLQELRIIDPMSYGSPVEATAGSPPRKYKAIEIACDPETARRHYAQQDAEREARRKLEEEEASGADVWPNVPYHYGMGRIQAYERWLESLSEEEREEEIAACRARYERHYQRVADALAARMKEKGHDLDLLSKPRKYTSAEVVLDPEKRRAYYEREACRRSAEEKGRSARENILKRSREGGRERTLER